MKNVHANPLNLFPLDLKNVVCIGYLEEKILMLQHGELHVNAIILMKNTIQIPLLNAQSVQNVLVLHLILPVYHVINHGKTI